MWVGMDAPVHLQVLGMNFSNYSCYSLTTTQVHNNDRNSGEGRDGTVMIATR